MGTLEEDHRDAADLPAVFGRVRRLAAFLGEHKAVPDRALAVRGVLEIVGLQEERLPASAHPARVPPELLQAGLLPDAELQARPVFRARSRELPGAPALESWMLLGLLLAPAPMPRASRR